MPIEFFFTLLIGGLFFIVSGLFVLVFKLYKINTIQGVVSEVNPTIGFFFGLLNWKYTKVPLLLILAGSIMLGSLFFV